MKKDKPLPNCPRCHKSGTWITHNGSLECDFCGFKETDALDPAPLSSSRIERLTFAVLASPGFAVYLQLSPASNLSTDVVHLALLIEHNLRTAEKDHPT